MIAVDDATNASLVPGICSRLLDVDKVDLIIGGYGTNTLQPAMPLVHGVDQFKDARTQVVVAPKEWASGELIYPYAKAPLTRATASVKGRTRR